METVRLLTLREVSELLGISRRTLTTYVRDDAFPVVRLSSASVRVDPRQLDAWLAGRLEQAPIK